MLNSDFRIKIFFIFETENILAYVKNLRIFASHAETNKK